MISKHMCSVSCLSLSLYGNFKRKCYNERNSGSWEIIFVPCLFCQILAVYFLGLFYLECKDNCSLTSLGQCCYKSKRNWVLSQHHIESRTRARRAGWAVKNTQCFCKGSRYSSQHPQPPKLQFWGICCIFVTSEGTRHKCATHYKQAKHYT